MYKILKLVRFFIVTILLIVNINVYASGKMTDIDGVKLYSEYYPNPTSPFKGTVVFINGSGTSMGEWGQNKIFFSKIKKTASLFFYDRSGLGNSPNNYNLSSKNPITAKLIADQLFTLLEKNHIPKPYIIVAHSYGSIYAGYFVLKHPSLVRALLLVDPVPKNFIFSKKLMSQFENGISQAKNNSAEFIYHRYSGADTEVIYQMLGFNQSKQELKSLGSINNKIPVVIISSTKMENVVKPVRGDWFTLQKQWLNQNSESRIFQVQSGHFIQIQRPNIVASQIVKMAKGAAKSQ